MGVHSAWPTWGSLGLKVTLANLLHEDGVLSGALVHFQLQDRDVAEGTGRGHKELIWELFSHLGVTPIGESSPPSHANWRGDVENSPDGRELVAVAVTINEADENL